MQPELVLTKQHLRELHEEASRYRLAKLAKEQRPRHRAPGLLRKLRRAPEAGAASAARRENPA